MTADAPLVSDRLAAAFDLGDWEDIDLIVGGKSQHHLVTTNRGRFVLRRSYRAKAADDVRFEHELVAHLRGGGFPGPEFVPTRDGEPFAMIDDRLWRVSVFAPGQPARADDATHLETVARTLAWYHTLVDGFTASVPAPSVPRLPDALRNRLDAVAEGLSGVEGNSNGGTPTGGDALRYALETGELVTARLEAMWNELPTTTVHAGCRRGSALFDGDRLVVMLDFDSAHTDVRALDLAVAVHDFAKIYGDPGSADYKVHLDAGVKDQFLAVYRGHTPLLPVEVEAIGLVLVAKRLKRAFGRHSRMLRGEPLSANDHKKIDLELARVRSLLERDGSLPVRLGA
ncbi:MAG: phosphotransferase [Acidimicrobiia bacterium]